MTEDQLRQFLTEKNVQFTEKEVQNGVQLKCQDGEIFTVYDSGVVDGEGPFTELSKAVLGELSR